jgi:hypothetical protein
MGEPPALHEVNALLCTCEVRLGHVWAVQKPAKRHPFGPKARDESSRGQVRQGRTQPPVPKPLSIRP